MSTVFSTRDRSRHAKFWRYRVASILVVMLVGQFHLSEVAAQRNSVHYQHTITSPPGAIGRWQLLRGVPGHGVFQPVEIRAPQGALISLALDDAFDEPLHGPRRVGLHVAPVYRIKVSQVPFLEDMEFFPTIELIDRLYPPPEVRDQFPIILEFTAEDLELAAQGKYVTRVVYVEDSPGPAAEDLQPWIDVEPGEDALKTADAYGRPVAILRLGGRYPGAEGPDAEFLYHSPPFEEIFVESKVKDGSRISRNIRARASRPSRAARLPRNLR